jgi:hydroxymethylbilane synthase
MLNEDGSRSISLRCLELVSVSMITIGSRGSALALVQTGWIKEQILSHFPHLEVTVKVIKTSADKNPTASLRAGSTIGVFVKELEQALLSKEIDLAVHSMKDVPTEIPDALRIAAVPQREDARDAFISDKVQTLHELPSGSLIGTGSLRRQSQILAYRADLRIADIRGNVDTRLKKMQCGDYDAIILACAGLHRLGLEKRISSPLDFALMLPAPGQGALAVETRADDAGIETITAALDHRPTALAVGAERNFLQHMGGGCNVPVAVYARLSEAVLEIDALVASPDGRKVVRDSIQQSLSMAEEAVAILADRILCRGGREILGVAL